MQVRRVLAGTSLRAPNPRAALTAAEVATVAHAELEVLTVLANPWELVHADEVEGLRRAHLGSPAEVAAQRACEQLQRLAGPAALAAPRVSYGAAFGWPSVELVRRAEESDADLIVLGNSGGAPLGPAEDVTPATLRRSRVPVLIAPQVHEVYQRVLACVDDSPHAFRVLEAATTLGDCFGIPTAALHIEPASSAILSEGGRRPWLTRLEEETTGGGGTVVALETIVRQGDVVSEILNEANSGPAALIVFGYHRGMNYGAAGAVTTVAARLLRRAKSALLAVPV
jgi:nucleotide-binding universal stress UspA family protein